MTTFELRSKVDANGVLNLSVPIGRSDANREVRVTIQSIEDGESKSTHDWHHFVDEMAGSIRDTSFIRQDQGEYEKRNELFP